MLLNCGIGEYSWESRDCKEIQPVHPKGDQSWVFIGRTDVEAETSILWPPDAKSWLFGKDSDAGRDWGQEEKGTIEDEMAGWHHWLNGHGFEWTPGVGDGQEGLACCGSWGRRVRHDWAIELNWTPLGRYSWCPNSNSCLLFKLINYKFLRASQALATTIVLWMAWDISVLWHMLFPLRNFPLTLWHTPYALKNLNQGSSVWRL